MWYLLCLSFVLCAFSITKIASDGVFRSLPHTAYHFVVFQNSICANKSPVKFFDSLRGPAWCGNAVYMARINLDFDMWLRFLWLSVKSLQRKQLKCTSLGIVAKSVEVVTDVFAGSMDH